MKTFIFKLGILFVFIGFLSTKNSLATPLMAPLDQVFWEQQGDRFSCQLSTDISKFGSISFVKKAGYEMTVKTSSVIYSQPISSQAFGLSKPLWSEKVLPEIRWSSLATDEQAALDASELMLQMQRGHWGHVALNYVDQSRVHLVLPTVQRAESFEDYFYCISQLSPLSYDQVREQNYYFDISSVLLSAKQQQQLNDVVRFVELEPRVSKILIDGHADTSGHAISNLRLSQQRADDLYAYLLEAGIDEKLIEVRSHGDRFPLANNKSQDQRAKNRRVNLRIILQKSS